MNSHQRVLDVENASYRRARQYIFMSGNGCDHDMCVRLGEALDDYHFAVREAIKELEKFTRPLSMPSPTRTKTLHGPTRAQMPECDSQQGVPYQNEDKDPGDRVDRLMLKLRGQDPDASFPTAGMRALQRAARRRSMPVTPTAHHFDGHSHPNSNPDIKDSVDRLILSLQGRVPNLFSGIQSSTASVRMRPLSMVGTIHVGIDSSIAEYPSSGTMKALPPTPCTTHTSSSSSNDLCAALDGQSAAEKGESRGTMEKDDNSAKDAKNVGRDPSEEDEDEPEDIQVLLPNRVMHHSKTISLPTRPLDRGEGRRDKHLHLRRKSTMYGQPREPRRWNSMRKGSLNGFSGVQRETRREMDEVETAGLKRWHSIRKLHLDRFPGRRREKDEPETPDHVPLKAAAVLGLNTHSAQRMPLKHG